MHSANKNSSVLIKTIFNRNIKTLVVKNKNIKTNILNIKMYLSLWFSMLHKDDAILKTLKQVHCQVISSALANTCFINKFNHCFANLHFLNVFSYHLLCFAKNEKTSHYCTDFNFTVVFSI